MDNSQRRVLITGATGFIGQALVFHLARKGYSVTALVRDLKRASHLLCEKIIWDGHSEIEFLNSIQRFDAVIHLAGEPIAAARWTQEMKIRMRDSRVLATAMLVNAFQNLPKEKRPGVFLSGSAIGFYGDRGDEVLFETSKKGSGFLSDLCAEWEGQALKAEALGVRTVLLRTGMVLGQNGGVLQKMKPVVLGNGTQWMSWIHLEDALGLIEFAVENENVKGPVHLSAPQPVRNVDFVQTLRKFRRFPPLPAVPGIMIRAALGEMAQLLLSSQRIAESEIVKGNYSYRFPTLESALGEIYPKPS